MSGSILDLEAPICDLHLMTNVAVTMGEQLSGTIAKAGEVTISQRYRDTLLFILDDLQARAETLETAYYAAIDAVKQRATS